MNLLCKIADRLTLALRDTQHERQQQPAADLQRVEELRLEQNKRANPATRTKYSAKAETQSRFRDGDEASEI